MTHSRLLTGFKTSKMQSIRVVNRILLGSVAFSVSFVLGLLANRDINKALLTGVITVPGTYAGSAIAEKRRIYQEKLLRGSLQNQIQELEEEESQLYQSLASATATRQEVEASINALQGERSQLLNRVSDLHIQRNELYRELSDFQKQKQHPDLVTLESQKRHLEGEAYDLQTQIQVLQQRQDQLNQVLAPLQEQQHEIEASLLAGKAKLDQLLSQISDKRKQQKKLDRDLANLGNRKQQLETECQNLQTQIQMFVLPNTVLTQTSAQNLGSTILQIIPEEWREGLEFAQQLSQDEQKAFKAILEQDSVTLKRIAEENLMMPEVLIESINEKAINTFGDTLLVSGSASVSPELQENYSSIFADPITLYFRDLLTPIQDYLSSNDSDTVTEIYESVPESIEVMNSK